ncbi:MAG: hypothetical protein L0215_14870 [Gemmataceae bacterium]|nr:hypothetical protein [Gemmataceae bacterium]
MKNAKLCPKCDSHDILRLPGQYSGNSAAQSQNLAATQYICCKCGYSEEWFDDLKELAKTKEQQRP